MPQLPAAEGTAAHLAARRSRRCARCRRAARSAGETNVLATLEASTVESGTRGGIGGRIRLRSTETNSYGFVAP